jgi:transposase-like protein
MVELQCKKCGSRNVKRNGMTKSGRQQYHCRDCGVYTTTTEGARDWKSLFAQIEQLHHEGVSQHGISRLTDVSRATIRAFLKKRPSQRLAKA